MARLPRDAPVHPNVKCFAVSLGCALALLTSSGAARAQGQGVGTLTGTVVDAATAKPIAGAVVRAASPQLQGEQLVVTDSTGTYRLPQLPPGVYTLRFGKEKYQSDSRGDIALNADQTLRVNSALIPQGVSN
jgi:Carboxypeptidase regulatory-like domain